MARLPLLLIACMTATAAAAAPPPTLGAGPHLDRSETRGGEGRWRGDVPEPPKVPATTEPAPSTGASTPPGAGEDAERARKEDERRATDRMNRIKKRPGFQKDAQPPRADAPAGRATN